MQLLPEQQQQKIRSTINTLSPKLRNENISIIVFEILGTIVLSFGICASQYKLPIQDNIQNNFWTFIISCFYFLAISISRPFSTGYVNTSVTIGLLVGKLVKSNKLIYCIGSQIVGAILGSLICKIFGSLVFAFFHKTSAFYVAVPTFFDIFKDAIGEFVGTFIFLFGILHIQKRKYMHDEPSKYFFVSLMLFVGRTWTYRKGCLNPVIAIAFQIFEAGRMQNILLLLCCFGIIIGSIVGGICGTLFYLKIYQPFYIEIEAIENK